MQTAHEPSYLVKHLLGSLPPVVDRVKLMRKGQAPNGSQEDNFAKMAQSQVSHASVAASLFTCHHLPSPCVLGLCAALLVVSHVACTTRMSQEAYCV